MPLAADVTSVRGDELAVGLLWRCSSAMAATATANAKEISMSYGELETNASVVVGT